MNAIASEFRHLRREVVRIQRKLALERMTGKVDQIRHRNGWEVRLDLGEDPETGQKVLSPWSRVQPASAGAMKIKIKPTIGEQMYLESASGVVGADSVAHWGGWTDEHPAPAGEEDTICEVGSTRVAISDGRFEVKVGERKVIVRSERIETVGRTYLGLDGEGEDGDKVLTEGGSAKQTFAKVE